MIKVLLPWNLQAYKPLNACHPLLYSLVDHAPDGLEFIMTDAARYPDDPAMRYLVFNWLQDMHRATAHMPHIDACLFMVELIKTYDPVMQLRIASYGAEADIVFHHTAPVHVNGLPFVVHFESLTTMFYPFLEEGKTRGIDIRALPVFAMVRDKLASPLCRGIFSHMKAGVDSLIRCFNDSAIERKTCHIPLGVALPAKFAARAEAKLLRPGRTGALNILFTNSAHGQESNFFLRGGCELIDAFGKLVATAPESQLVIISKRPGYFQTLPSDIADKVEWIEDPISDEKLFDLLLWSDVFALPAVGLHSYSALRALKSGSVLICSDAPGYEELVESPKTAVMIPGRRDSIYNYDPQTGFMHGDFGVICYPDPEISVRLAAALYILAHDPDQRHRIATEAYRHVCQAHAIEPWSQGVGNLIKAALA